MILLPSCNSIICIKIPQTPMFIRVKITLALNFTSIQTETEFKYHQSFDHHNISLPCLVNFNSAAYHSLSFHQTHVNTAIYISDNILINHLSSQLVCLAPQTTVNSRCTMQKYFTGGCVKECGKIRNIKTICIV